MEITSLAEVVLQLWYYYNGFAASNIEGFNYTAEYLEANSVLEIPWTGV